MNVPGAAWVALILALTGLLGGWLTEYIEQPWVPLAVMALSLVAKAAEIYITDNKQAANREVVGETPKRSVTSRLLLG